MNRRLPENPDPGPPPDAPDAPFRFDQLPRILRENVARLGWKEPMPVQERVIPLLSAGRDLVVQSRTGSGKTGAFVLPMLMRVDPAQDRLQADRKSVV